MNAEQFSSALGKVNDKYIMEAVAYERKKKNDWLKWGALAACFGLIFTMTMAMLPSILRGHGNIEPPSNPDVPGPVATNEDSQPSVEPSQSSADRNIIISWDNVAVNESEDVAPHATRCPVDPSLYDTESWGEDEIVSYYGWNLAPAYIPDDLAGGNKPWGFMCKEKVTGKIVEDEGGRRFLVDGATNSSDRGFTIYASRSGILHCYLLPVDEEQTTDFGGVPVTLSHASVPYGPFDPEKMDLSGLYHQIGRAHV